MGKRTIDDFHSSTVQAACGGVTTVIDYVFPAPGETLMQGVESWIAKAKGKTIIDYGLHPTLFKPDDQMLQEMSARIGTGRRGTVRSILRWCNREALEPRQKP